MITLDLSGTRQLRGALDDLAGRRLRAIQRKAINAGGQVVAKKERELAPRLSGTLAKAIAKKVKIYRGSGVAVAIVGPRTKFKKVIGATRKGEPIFRWPSKTAGLVEAGTRRSRPRPFVAPAAAASGDAAATAMAQKAAEELAK